MEYNHLVEFSNKFLDNDDSTEDTLVNDIKNLDDVEVRSLFKHMFKTDNNTSSSDEIKLDLLRLVSHLGEFQTKQLVQAISAITNGYTVDIDEGMFDAFKKKTDEEKKEIARKKGVKKNVKLATKEFAQEKKAKAKKAGADDISRRERNSKLAYGFGLEESKGTILDSLFGTDESYNPSHPSHTKALTEVTRYIESLGYELDESEMSEDVMGWGKTIKLYEGDVNRFVVSLYKEEVLQKKALHAQIYGKGKEGYTLNMYLS